jgi:hypothetical protein
MDGRYEVFATHGKGVFSTVLRARDRGAPDAAPGRCPEVAVKVIRANDIMYKARRLPRFSGPPLPLPTWHACRRAHHAGACRVL